MDSDLVLFLGSIGGHLGPVGMSVMMFLTCYAVMLALWGIWGVQGMFLYNVMAVVIANIQVLKLATFPGMVEPVALGTILFATTFTATDILVDVGKKSEAKLCIKTSFASQIIMTLFMLMTVAFPVEGGVTGYANNKVVGPVQYAMCVLFVPSFRITIASLVSYYVSQLVDVYVFSLVAKMTKNKMVWLRFNVASLVSGFCDNVIFSVLAWVVLSPDPVKLKTLIFTYIIGTYLSRILVAVASTPVMYIAKWIRSR